MASWEKTEGGWIFMLGCRLFFRGRGRGGKELDLAGWVFKIPEKSRLVERLQLPL